MKDTKIVIEKKEYLELKLASEKLYLLECGGVNNWEWYGESLFPDDKESFTEIENRLKQEIFGGN